MKGPLFKWYGSKWLSSRLLPAPKHDFLIEPFAGGAGYSLRHAHKNVVLWDDDPNLRVLWPWLIKAKPSEILEIPVGLKEGVDVRDIGLSLGQQYLLKHWQRTNNVGDCWTTSPWGSLPGQWTANTRARVADEVGEIAHWKFRRVSWQINHATYFVDPPYLYNYRYRFKKEGFNYELLAQDVAKIPRTSQVIVCEAVCPKTDVSPTYLPFEFFGNRITSRRKKSEHHHSKELVYVRG